MVYFLDAAGELHGEVAGLADADHRGRGVARRRAGRRGRHPRLGRDDRAQGAQARAHAGRARACRCGRSRSCPTIARCSPAAPTAWCAAGTRSPAITSARSRWARRTIRSRPIAGDPGAEVFRACVACHTLSRRRRQPRRADARRHFRAPDRDAARLQFLRCAEEARHRVDARDGREAVRGRPDGLHARHQDAGAAHRLGRGSQGADGVSGEGDDEIRIPVTLVCRSWSRGALQLAPPARADNLGGARGRARGRRTDRSSPPSSRSRGSRRTS